MRSPIPFVVAMLAGGIPLTAAAQLEAISDLKVTGSGNQVALAWTVPNDLPLTDGFVFPPVYYEVRCSTSGEINEANWYGATALVAPDPLRVGAPNPYETETLELPALDPNPALVYHFSVRWLSGTWYSFSPPSNDPAFSFDFNPPAAITTLEAISIRPGKVTLKWTSTGDDGQVGRASTYDLRRLIDASLPVSTDAWLSAERLFNLPEPANAGTAQTIDVDVPAAGGQVTFALSVADERSNWSPRSNVLTIMVTAEPAGGHGGGEKSGGCAGSAAGGTLLVALGLLSVIPRRR